MCTDMFRGGVKIENQENLGQCPNRGWVGNKKTEMTLFSKMSQYQLFDNVFCNITSIRNV